MECIADDAAVLSFFSIFI